MWKRRVVVVRSEDGIRYDKSRDTETYRIRETKLREERMERSRRRNGPLRMNRKFWVTYTKMEIFRVGPVSPKLRRGSPSEPWTCVEVVTGPVGAGVTDLDRGLHRHKKLPSLGVSWVETMCPIPDSPQIIQNHLEKPWLEGIASRRVLVSYLTREDPEVRVPRHTSTRYTLRGRISRNPGFPSEVCRSSLRTSLPLFLEYFLIIITTLIFFIQKDSHFHCRKRPSSSIL